MDRIKARPDDVASVVVTGSEGASSVGVLSFAGALFGFFLLMVLPSISRRWSGRETTADDARTVLNRELCANGDRKERPHR